jgi:hypothetical protein
VTTLLFILACATWFAVGSLVTSTAILWIGLRDDRKRTDGQ